MSNDSWVSLHLHQVESVYYQSGDALFLAAAADWTNRLRVEGLCDGAFVIRYRDRGPHVRWRVRPTLGMEHALLARMFELAETWTHKHILARIEICPYLPEIERYGGEALLPISESIFELSTQVATSWLLRRAPVTLSNRLGLACAASLAAFFTLGGSRSVIRHRSAQYSQGYLGTLSSNEEDRAKLASMLNGGIDNQLDSVTALVHRVLLALQSEDALDSELSAYQGKLRHLVMTISNQGAHQTSLSSPRILTESVIFSHVHMTNNRLGVQILDEAYICLAIARALESHGPSQHRQLSNWDDQRLGTDS